MAVLGLAGPAQAGQWEGVDPAHDVAAFDCKPGCHWKNAPSNASADMVRQVVSYRHDTIRITVTLRKVDTSAAFGLTSILKKTEKVGRYYGVIAQFSPGKTPPSSSATRTACPSTAAPPPPSSSATRSSSSSRRAACTPRSGCGGAATCA